jgi:hypothetical protein
LKGKHRSRDVEVDGRTTALNMRFSQRNCKECFDMGCDSLRGLKSIPTFLCDRGWAFVACYRVNFRELSLARENMFSVWGMLPVSLVLKDYI